MTITSVLFENGIEIGSARNIIKLPDEVVKLSDIYARISEEYSVRPILVTENIPSIGDPEYRIKRHSVLNLNWKKDPLNVLVSSLKLPPGIPEGTFVSLLRPMMNIKYVTGALVYHCQELAMLYSSICDSATELRDAFSIEEKTFSYQGQSEPYYEFDALITAARRTYDAFRYVLWPVFGKGGSMPSNFPKTIDSCVKLPDKLRNRLTKSWNTHGTKLTAYRDCIQHYVPVSFGIETAQLNQVVGGTWSVILRIPDNPEAKSQRNFRFAKGIDALTYGWELANELVEIASEIFTNQGSAHCEAPL